MSDDVLITPASRKIEFKDSGGTVDAKIETDSSGNLTITNPGGDISIGDTTADVFIGDGVNSIDLVFEQNGEIRGTSGVTLTLGDSNTTLKTGTSLDIAGSGAFQMGGLNVITSARNMQNIGNINIGGYYAMDGTTLIDTGKNIINVNNITPGGSFITSTSSSSLGIYAGSTQIFEGSTRNLKNLGSISSTTISASGTASPSAILSLGGSSQTTFALAEWRTDVHGSTEAYILAYGGSHSSQSGNFAMKNLEADGEIFFELASSVEPLRLTSTGATFAGNVVSSGYGLFEAADGGQGLYLDSTSSWSSGVLYAPGLLWREDDGTNIAGIRGYVDSSGTNKLALGTGWFDQELVVTPTGVDIAGSLSADSISGNTTIDPIFSTSYSATPSTRWVKFERPFLTGNGSSNFYSFRVVGYKQFGNEKSYQDYDVYIHIRSNGTTTNTFDITVTKKTPETDNEFSFSYRQPLDSGLTNRENEFYIVMDGTYSGIQIYPNHNADGAFVELTSSMFGFTDTQPSTLSGITVDEFITNQNPKVKGTLEFTGSAVYNALDLNNNNIIGVNNITMNDSGTGEGIQWANWHIYESPNDLSNANGNLQIVNGTTRRATFASTGLEVVDGTIKVTKDQDTLANVLSNGTYAAEFLSTDSGNTGHATGIILSGSSGTNRGASIVAQAQSSGNDHDLIFATSASAATPTEAMRITSDNKVGIGVNPARELDVGGGIQVRSGNMLQYFVSSWSNAPTHSVLSNSFKNTLGDYITLKAAGNNTSAHGAIVVADNGIFFGRTNIETGDLVANNSVTAPLDANWARIDTSGVLHCNRVSITNNATPLIFNQADQSNGTVGKWWRMPVDGTSLRFDVSLTGDGAFTTYSDVFTITAAGDAKLGGGGASDYNKLYFSRYGGASVGAIGWHSDAIFYIGGHPSYGSSAGNDVRVYGFGSDIHIGDNSNGDVITVKYDTGDVLVQAGTAASDPAVVRILSKTESNTTRGQYYAGLEFGVVGGEAGSGNFTNGVNTAIRAVDCRDGSTSYEDSGLGFYTMPSTGRTTPALRVAVTNEGGMHVMSDSTPLNVSSGTLIVDTNIGIGKDSPQYPLDISTTSGTGINVTDNDNWATILIDGGGGTDNILELSNFGNATSGSLIRTTGTGPLRLFAGNTEALSITANKKVGIGTNNLANSSNNNGVLAIGSAFMSSSASLFVDGFSRFSGPLMLSKDGGSNSGNYVQLNHSNDKLTLTDSGGGIAALDAPDGYYVSNTQVINSSRELTNITGLTLSSNSNNDNSITITDSTADTGFNGIKIDYNLSGSDTLTGDRTHSGIFLDIDSSASGGDTANEHRIYGVYTDLRVTGDSDLVYAGLFAARTDNFDSSNTGLQVTNLRGMYGQGNANHDGGIVANNWGVYGYAVNATSTAGQCTNSVGVYGHVFSNSTSSYSNANLYGGYFLCQLDDLNTSDINQANGVYSEIQIDNNIGTVLIDNAYAYRAEVDENDSDDSATITNAYLFYGNYSGSGVTNKYGIWIAGTDVESRFVGTVRTNTAFNVGGTNIVNSSRQLINLTFNGGSTGVRFARDVDLQDTGGVKRLRFNATGASAYNSTNGHFFQNGGTTKAEIQTDGDAIFAGDVTAYGSPSDINLKENIETIPNAVEKVQKLDGVTFNYKKDGGRSTGLIAQQLQEVLPEVVYTAKDLEGEEHLAVRYGNVVGLLVEALKEQQTQIDNLTALVNELKEK